MITAFNTLDQKLTTPKLLTTCFSIKTTFSGHFQVQCANYTLKPLLKHDVNKQFSSRVLKVVITYTSKEHTELHSYKMKDADWSSNKFSWQQQFIESVFHNWYATTRFQVCPKCLQEILYSYVTEKKSLSSLTEFVIHKHTYPVMINSIIQHVLYFVCTCLHSYRTRNYM
jgi:hypothetical protein